jgi:hypothetical protein
MFAHHVKPFWRVVPLGAEQKKLEPMRIVDSVTCGNYFDMPGDDIYHVKVWIRRGGVRVAECFPVQALSQV